MASASGQLQASAVRIPPAMVQACLDGAAPGERAAACTAILDLGDIPDYSRRDALVTRAEALMALGDPQRAHADAETLVRLAREPEDKARADALLGQALALLERYDEAATALDEALRLDPTDTESLDWLALRGRVLDRLHRDTEALRDLSAVVTLQRNQANPYLDRGRFYFRRGRFGLAKDDFEHAVANLSTSALPYYWRAMARLRLGDSDAAAADFDAAIHLHPRFPAALVRRAEIYEAVGDKARAADDFGLAAAGPENDPASEEARKWVAANAPVPQPVPQPVLQPIPLPVPVTKVAEAPHVADVQVSNAKLTSQPGAKANSIDDTWFTNVDGDNPKSQKE